MRLRGPLLGPQLLPQLVLLYADVHSGEVGGYGEHTYTYAILLRCVNEALLAFGYIGLRLTMTGYRVMTIGPTNNSTRGSSGQGGQEEQIELLAHLGMPPK